MWITSDVNLPEAVLEAQAQGRLVLFVGAGASVDAPSGLPLFDKLARQLAELARMPFDKNVELDFFLGSMPKTFDTHWHARNLITNERSAPNTTHAALVRVASSVGALRVVTTNFDNHLWSAAAAAGIKISDTWIGPALPLGEDFTGIVHLHGSVLREPKELVLTDQDFGRAYLTNAWATRFLLPMFQRNTVLFVGYSHDDPIMRYLALGLPSGTPRYAFTSLDETNDVKWSRLGVQTIGYPVHGNDHSALVAALEAWDLRARMGQTEHRARTVEVVNGGPRLTPVDNDYLVSQLMTVSGAAEFVHAVAAVDATRQVAWLQWAEDLPQFKALFEGQDGDEAANVLGNWFCQNFVAVPELQGAALQTLQRLGQGLSSVIFRAASWAAGELSKMDAEAGRRWKVFLATSIHGHSSPVVSETLLSYQPGDHPEDRAVLRAVLKPYIVLKRRWSFDDSDDLTSLPTAEVHWNTRERTLTGHVLKVVEANAPGDLTLGNVLEDSLSAAYDLLEAYNGKRTWDPLSFGRSAIEPHGQDQFRDPIDAVIDGLRVYGEKALPVRPNLPERWWSLGGDLFRRLSLHLLTLNPSRSPDEKISWLLERSTLYEIPLKHETYHVLQVLIEKASREVRNRLLAVALAGPELPPDTPDVDRHSSYATYNLLVWLAQIAPEWEEATTALASVQEANPGFAPRENPDFDKWLTSGTWGGKLPVEPDDFIRSFEENPLAAIEDLLNRDYSERNFDEPEWRDALSLVSQVAESRPELGEQLWSLLDNLQYPTPQANDLRQATVEGWGKATLGDAADAIVARVATQVSNPEFPRSVSRFLLEQIRQHIDIDDNLTLAAMRRIALRLWNECGQSFTHTGEVDHNSFAPLYLNSWPGDLILFWLAEVDRRWRQHRDDWSGLSHEEAGALTQLLEGPRDALDATQPAAASHLFFLFAADPAFTTANVLPLFHNESTATMVWSSYLHYPRYDDKLLGAGFLDSTIAEWDRLDELGEGSLQNQFFTLVASIVSFAGITPESRQTLLDQSVLAADGRYLATFAQAVVRFIGEDGVDGSQVWKGWLREHLMARLDGVPRSSDLEELTCWADTIPYVGDGIPEAVGMLTNKGIELGNEFLLPNFREEALAAHGAIIVAHFAERVRNSSSEGHFIAYHVKELIEALRPAVGDILVEPLVQAAMAKGFLRRGDTNQ